MKTLERVARALAKENGDENGTGWEIFIHEAKAALKALREFETEDFTMSEAAGIRRIIDEALEDDPTPPR